MMEMHKPAKERNMTADKQKLLNQLIDNFNFCRIMMDGMIVRLDEADRARGLDSKSTTSLERMKEESTKASINISLLRSGFFNEN